MTGLPLVCFLLTAFMGGVLVWGLTMTETNPEPVKAAGCGFTFIVAMTWLVLWIVWGVRALHL